MDAQHLAEKPLREERRRLAAELAQEREEKRARLAGMQLYRSTRGYIDKHGRPVSDENVALIKSSRTELETVA